MQKKKKIRDEIEGKGNIFSGGKIKRTLKYTSLIIGAFLIYCLAGAGVSSTYEDDCIGFLNNRGFTQIEVLGWDPIAEREDDITSMEFKAMDKDGNEIKGVVIVSGSVVFGETYQVKYYN